MEQEKLNTKMQQKELAMLQLSKDLAKLRNQGHVHTIDASLYSSPVSTTKKHVEAKSSVKTRNYWEQIEKQEDPAVAGPFVDLKETHRHKNRVQKLNDKTH